jgi:lysophospholipase L1-like esterase
MLGVAISPARPARPAPAWMATRNRLRTHLLANDGADSPHVVPMMADPPTIITGAGSASAPPAPYDGLTQSYRYAAGTLDGVMRFEGGGEAAYFTDYRRFPVATLGASGGNMGGGQEATVWRGRVLADAAEVAFRVLGGVANAYRFIVDGAYISASPTSIVTGGRQYIVLDFGSKAEREIIIEGALASAIDGVHVAPGDSLALPPALPVRALVLGDSVTAGIGAGFAGDGMALVMADALGIEAWASGVSGSGYVATAGGSVYTLAERLAADVGRFQAFGTTDLVIVALGLNDMGLSGIEAEASACLDAIRQAAPDALVMVLPPWDAAAPGAPSADYLAAKAAIASAAQGRSGFWLLDCGGVAYSKADAVHPDTEGHGVLGEWLALAIRAAIGA